MKKTIDADKLQEKLKELEDLYRDRQKSSPPQENINYGFGIGVLMQVNKIIQSMR